MSMTNHPLEQAVREYVHERYERGSSHVKTPHVAKALDETPQRVVPVMRALVRDGTLEVWRENTNATVYRINSEPVNKS